MLKICRTLKEHVTKMSQRVTWHWWRSSFFLAHLFQLVSQDLDLFLILVLLLRILWWEQVLFRCRSIYERNSTFDPISISEKWKNKHTFTFLQLMLMLANSEKKKKKFQFKIKIFLKNIFVWQMQHRLSLGGTMVMVGRGKDQ